VTAATLPRMHGLEVVDAEGAAATGDTADLAVVELELRHGQALFGFVRRQGLTDSEAEDAVQEALLRLWLEIRNGRSIDNPRAWAYRAAYRIAMDSHRLHRRVTGILQRLDGRPSATPTRDATDQLAVWAEVDTLPVRQRQVLYLRYRADLSFQEIGVTLGITASAARSHATQAMATLRQNLASDEER
jgi:RNA polymerase sigma factor (sigma-70 family)